MIHWLHYFIAYQHSMRIKWINMNGPAGFFYNLSQASIRFSLSLVMRFSMARHWWRQPTTTATLTTTIVKNENILGICFALPLPLSLSHAHSLSQNLHSLSHYRVRLPADPILFFTACDMRCITSTYKNCLLFWQMNAYVQYAAMKAIWCI